MPIEGLDILKPGDDEPKKKHITKEEARDKYGVHDCIHDGEGHICGCEIGHDHEALNP